MSILAKGKSGVLVRARVRCPDLAQGEKAAQTDDTVQPALASGGAQVGQMLCPVVGMRVRMAVGSSAKEVEIDAVHVLRPICRFGFKDAMKHGTIRIRKILGT